MRCLVLALALAGCLIGDQAALAQSIEDQNGCQGTTDDPCIRNGACSVQGAVWDQTVTIDRADLYDTMGWAGVCDQVHVALVQGNCTPGGSQLDVTVSLQANSTAEVPEIIGPLACNAEPAPGIRTGDVFAWGVLGSVFLASGVLFLRDRSARNLAG